MNKWEVAHRLRTMGALLEIRGENSFKVRSYRRAADSIESSDYDLDRLAAEGRLTDIPGVGKNLEPKVREMIRTGRSSYLEKLVLEIPEGVLDLLRVPGIGPKTARLLYNSLGVAGLDDLDVALKAHKVRNLPGIGRKREELMAEGLLEIRRYAGRVSIGVAYPVVESIVDSLGAKGITAGAVGEVRRGEETVSTLDILVLQAGQESPIELVKRSGILPEVDDSVIQEAWDSDAGRYSFDTGLGVPLWLYFAGRDLFWSRVLYLTGPLTFLSFFNEQGKDQGLVLSQSGLLRDGKSVGVPDEDSLFGAVSLAPIPAEVRHRPEFWDASRRKEVPELVSVEDLQGDIHLHTVWSDGTASIEEMVQAAIGVGYSYIAITDHATEMKMIRGITRERLSEQLLEIENVRAKYPDFRIYSGVEVDILKDGRLYLPDEDLAKLDVVIASIHQDIDSGVDGANRLIKAAMNPHVDVLGHPTGRLIGRRPGSVVGLDAVLDAAVLSETVVEINSSPERLDLPEDSVALGSSKGVKFAICTDAHSPRGLSGIRNGVLACARRAGISAKQVVNTLTVLPWMR